MSEIINKDETGYWDKNSYEWALEIAGAKILAFEAFGSYQGDWVAKVEWNGAVGWIKDYYGSCSGCDAFEAEMDWGDTLKKENVVDFAKRYLEEMKSYDEVLKEASENLSWDLDAQEMVDFIRKNKEEHHERD